MHRFFRFAGLLLGLALPALLLPAAARPAPAVQAEPEIGPVWAVALDASGDGWAWAAPAPQTFATSFLIRVEQGAWRVAADSLSDPELLPPGLWIADMVLTTDGRAGWAIGWVEEEEADRPILWRMQNGTWRVHDQDLPLAFQPVDVTLTADGGDGWMTGYDAAEEVYRLLRLRDGVWDLGDAPAAGALAAVAISPDGTHGWAMGPRDFNYTRPPTLFRLVEGRWVGAPAVNLTANHGAMALAADNAGNGWLITILNYELAAHRRVARPLALDPRGQLFRLTPNAPPREVVLDSPLLDPDAEGEFYLIALGLDSLGHGWALGGISVGPRLDPPNPDWTYTPIAVRLRGNSATVVPAEVAGLPPGAAWDLGAVGVSPDGAHAWSGGADGFNFGHLAELREPWPHAQPPAAAPLPGAGRCFAAVPYCLRGVFAAYWAANGGLDQFGYPITPEIQETQGDRTYTVQYTERARFEYHPENAPPYDVLLGLLGNTLVEGRLEEAPFKAGQPSILPDTQWFPATGHTLGPPFLAYWQSHGGLPVFGLPRSEAFDERNRADGNVYRVQYFERNRIEYHPENKGTPFEFLLGLLGVEQFSRTYGYTP
jgi:hypothetical protein